MKNTRTAAVLLAALFLLILSVCPGLPQAAKAAEPMTVEGSWMVSWTTPEAQNLRGTRFTIRRKGPGEYELFDPFGSKKDYSGSPTEIKAVKTYKFEELKELFSKTTDTLPDAALKEAAAAGVQRTIYLKLSPDGNNVLLSWDSPKIPYNLQSGHWDGKEIEIKPPKGTSAILTRVTGKTGWLGVEVKNVTHELAQAFNLNETHGVLVVNVVKGSPAEQGKIKPGDIILKYKDNEIESSFHMISLIANTNPGASVPIKILRNKKEESFNVIIGKVPLEPVKSTASVTPKKEVNESEEEQVSKPAPKAKSAPRQPRPEGGSPPPPELPAGGALSGN